MAVDFFQNYLPETGGNHDHRLAVRIESLAAFENTLKA